MKGSVLRRVAPQWWLLSALIFLIVACLVFVGWVYVARAGNGGMTERTEALRADVADASQVRAELRQRAAEFVEEFFTYGPDDLDEDGSLAGFKERVRPLMSAKFQTALDQRLLQIEGIVAQYQVRSAGTVQGVGVASFDDDSAEVLVGGWGTQAYPNPKKKSEEIKGDRLPFRFQVSLVQVDGEWLVDNLDSFDDQGEGLADPTESPSPSAPEPSAPEPSAPDPSAPDSSAPGTPAPSSQEGTP